MLLIFLLLSNVISDNMMSRLILILRKQFFDNQFAHFNSFPHEPLHPFEPNSQQSVTLTGQSSS